MASKKLNLVGFKKNVLDFTARYLACRQCFDLLSSEQQMLPCAHLYCQACVLKSSSRCPECESDGAQVQTLEPIANLISIFGQLQTPLGISLQLREKCYKKLHRTALAADAPQEIQNKENQAQQTTPVVEVADAAAADQHDRVTGDQQREPDIEQRDASCTRQAAKASTSAKNEDAVTQSSVNGNNEDEPSKSETGKKLKREKATKQKTEINSDENTTENPRGRKRKTAAEKEDVIVQEQDHETCTDEQQAASDKDAVDVDEDSELKPSKRAKSSSKPSTVSRRVSRKNKADLKEEQEEEEEVKNSNAETIAEEPPTVSLVQATPAKEKAVVDQQEFKMPTKSALKGKRSRVDCKSEKTVSFPDGSGMVLLSSNIVKDQLKKLEEFEKKFKCKLVTEYSDAVTHFVTSCDDNRLAQRTYKYLMALLGHKYLLTFDWIKDSLKKKMLVPEEDYEVQGTTKQDPAYYGAPKISRETQCKLFIDKHFYLDGKYSSQVFLGKDELCKLIRLGGGTVLETQAALKASQKLAEYPIYYIIDPQNTNSKFAAHPSAIPASELLTFIMHQKFDVASA